MSWIVGLWIVIILVRWVLPSVWNFFAHSATWLDWSRRGKVLGHRGPGPRSFKGRAGRREWWLSMLGNTLAGAIIGAVPTIGPLLSLPWLIGSLAVSARRLHDLSLSAWFQLIPMAFGAVFIAGYMHLGAPDNPPVFTFDMQTPAGWMTAFGAAAAIVYLGFYLIVGFAPGKSGPNFYAEADPA